MQIYTDDRKYETILDEDTGRITVLRHGEEWRDETGDNYILSLIHVIEQMRDDYTELHYENELNKVKFENALEEERAEINSLKELVALRDEEIDGLQEEIYELNSELNG
ncbi:hypothetical protein [Escherichia phage phiWec190]|nr:hypothetical protein [Escherichia phage phiWec188]BDU13692.1 hypothetical protein [Escherichia phage phiWec190]